MFVCADPAIYTAICVPLMLQTVSGLEAGQIAAAFLSSLSAMAQRLVRAVTALCVADAAGPQRRGGRGLCQSDWPVHRRPVTRLVGTAGAASARQHDLAFDTHAILANIRPVHDPTAAGCANVVAPNLMRAEHMLSCGSTFPTVSFSRGGTVVVAPTPLYLCPRRKGETPLVHSTTPSPTGI